MWQSPIPQDIHRHRHTYKHVHCRKTAITQMDWREKVRSATSVHIAVDGAHGVGIGLRRATTRRKGLLKTPPCTMTGNSTSTSTLGSSMSADNSVLLCKWESRVSTVVSGPKGKIMESGSQRTMGRKGVPAGVAVARGGPGSIPL